MFQYKNDGLVVFARKICHGYSVAWGPLPAHYGEDPKKADVDHAGETGERGMMRLGEKHGVLLQDATSRKTGVSQ